MSVKPAMAVRTTPDIQSPTASAEGSLPGAPPRGPHQPTAPDHRRLAVRFDLRISPDLRERLKAAAERQGVSDGAYLRNLIATAVGVEGEAAPPRVRIPTADLDAISTAVRELGALHQPASLGRWGDVLAGHERIRQLLIPACVRLSRGAA